jgi:hypothetical protein
MHGSDHRWFRLIGRLAVVGSIFALGLTGCGGESAEEQARREAREERDAGRIARAEEARGICEGVASDVAVPRVDGAINNYTSKLVYDATNVVGIEGLADADADDALVDWDEPISMVLCIDIVSLGHEIGRCDWGPNGQQTIYDGTEWSLTLRDASTADVLEERVLTGAYDQRQQCPDMVPSNDLLFQSRRFPRYDYRQIADIVGQWTENP